MWEREEIALVSKSICAFSDILIFVLRGIDGLVNIVPCTKKDGPTVRLRAVCDFHLREETGEPEERHGGDNPNVGFGLRPGIATKNLLDVERVLRGLVGK